MVADGIEIEASVPQLTLTDSDEGSSELGNQAMVMQYERIFGLRLEMILFQD